MSWDISDHVCRACLGRILIDRKAHTARCSNCGITADDTNPRSLCACGTKLRGGQDAGIRCIRNPEPSPDFPAEIVATEVDIVAKRHPATRKQASDPGTLFED